MEKLYELLIIASLANCEACHLTKMVDVIENSEANQSIKDCLPLLKIFITYYQQKLDDINLDLKSYLSSFNSDTSNSDTVDAIRSSCDKIRSEFHNSHKNFILFIDNYNSSQLQAYDKKIDYALSIANIYITDTLTDKSVKEKLENWRSYITSNLKPLEPQLEMLTNYINLAPIKYSDHPHEKILGVFRYYTFQYLTMLNHLLAGLKNKLDFIFSTELSMEPICNKIINIAYQSSVEFETKNSLSNNSIFTKYANTNHEEARQAINFIYNNLDFFTAPFDDQPQFQTWCQHNQDDVFPLSAGLSIFLRSTDQFVAFKRALIGASHDDTNCLRAGNNTLMKTFFKHPTNLKLAPFLNQFIDDPLIEKWYIDNKPAIYQAKNVCKRM